MHDSFMPLSGLILLSNMMLDEVIVGGPGSGLFGMLLFAIVAVFAAGLMIGRTPEYLGKKLESNEIKMTMLALLCPPACILGLAALAVVVPAGLAGLENAGPHGFSEALYAYTSAAATNGSAFAGLSANTMFYNLTLAAAMFVGRFIVIVPVLCIAGTLAAKRIAPVSAGTLPTHGALFVGLLVGVAVIVGGLSFVPGEALGPVAELLAMPGLTYRTGGARHAARPDGPRHINRVARRVLLAPDAPVREVARTLLEHGISAMPVLDADGIPIGMGSEGGLVSRDELERVARRDWWLKLVSDDAAPESGFLAKLRAPDRTAGDVMSAPIITVGEDTELPEVARLLAQHHIKRVPVVKQGRVAGIVSRADLLHALATPQPDAPAARPAPRKRGFLRSMFGEYHRPAWEIIPPREDAAPAAPSAGLNAAAFRTLMEDHQTDAAQHQDEARRAAAERRQQLAKELTDTHVTDDNWQDLLHRARQAAAAGEKECLLLRFPNELCTDGGRAIDVAGGDLARHAARRGGGALPALGTRTEAPRLSPDGPRAGDYPAGMPGDIGLFLVWGEAT